MKCVICKNGNTQNGLVTVSLEFNKKTFVFKEVPARVCENCGEQYFEESITKKILADAKKADLIGTEVTIAKFVA